MPMCCFCPRKAVPWPGAKPDDAVIVCARCQRACADRGRVDYKPALDDPLTAFALRMQMVPTPQPLGDDDNGSSAIREHLSQTLANIDAIRAVMHPPAKPPTLRVIEGGKFNG